MMDINAKLIKYLLLFLDNLNPKKVGISKFLTFSAFMAHSKQNSDYFFFYNILKKLKTNVFWFSVNLNCFLNALRHLRLKKVKILELGSHHGISAYFFLFYLKYSKIVFVDAYSNVSKANLLIFKKNLANFRKKKRVKLYNCSTLEFFSKFSKKNFYDICYIDAGHGYIDVLIDLLLAFDQVKNHGYVLIDDYRWYDAKKVSLNKSVRRAVNDFLKFADGQYKVLHHDYSIILKKTKNLDGFQLEKNYY